MRNDLMKERAEVIGSPNTEKIIAFNKKASEYNFGVGVSSGNNGTDGPVLHSIELIDHAEGDEYLDRLKNWYARPGEITGDKIPLR